MNEPGSIESGVHEPAHKLERLIFFSDAVFAISITLLIFDVRPPHMADGASVHAWLQALSDMLPKFGSFIISFLTIGAMWSRHHAVMSLLYRFDQRLIWPNLLMLMSVVFLPFSTALMSQGMPSPVPYTFYGASLLAAGLLKAWSTRVALRPDLIRPDVPAAQIRAERRRIWIMPLAAAVTMLLGIYYPGPNNLGMLLIPIGRRLPWFDE